MHKYLLPENTNLELENELVDEGEVLSQCVGGGGAEQGLASGGEHLQYNTTLLRHYIHDIFTYKVS